jgi:phage shock protein E
MNRLLLICIFLISCSKTETAQVLSPKNFQDKYTTAKNPLLLDVRTEQEVASGKIMTAQNIVYDDAFSTKLDTLKQQPVFIYCGTGKRSAKAAKILREKGFEVYELEGGITAWQNAGLPIN